MLPIMIGEKGIVNIPLKYITPNPNQPRKYIDRKQIESLALSIEENGLINPVTLKKIKKDKYFIICGERRFLAFKFLGRDTIPAIIKDAEKVSVSALALVENTQRQELNFLEEARAIKNLIDEEGISQNDCAKKLGLTQSSVANKLRILRLPEEVLKLLAENNLTERHARALLSAEGSPKLKELAQKVIKENLNVRQTEKLCLSLNEKKTSPPIIVIKDIRVFSSSLRSAIEYMKKAGYDVKATSCENENEITYTVVVPKRSQRFDAI